MSTEYDAENVFAQILDKKVPCFKVFESRSSLAFLDAYPMTEGHTLVIPKSKGHRDFLSMPPAKAAELLADVQYVARAVKEAMGATSVNIWQNSGESAGQKVSHPCFHVVPRKKDDNVNKYPASAKTMIEKDVAMPMVEKIEAALNPPKPLKKATFGKVVSLKPEMTGLNLRVKVVEDIQVIDSKAGQFWEVRCGDASGTMVVSLREHQKDLVTKDAVIELRNASVKMVANSIRVVVDKWGKILPSEETIEGEVPMETEKNVSKIEFELVGN